MTADREGRELTLIQRRLLEAAMVPRDEATKDPDFTHTVLTSVYLPVSNPGDATEWDRRSGGHRLRIETGSIPDPTSPSGYTKPGLPFGAKARLVMIYLISEAVRSQSRDVEVGEHLKDFLARLGLGSGGREYTAVKEQLRRLSAATIHLTVVDDEGRGRWQPARFVAGMEFWASTDPRQRLLWNDTVTLDETFFRSVRRHAVPLADKDIAALKNSPLALDVYAWLAGRLHRVEGVEAVGWRRLFEQFAQGYQNTPAGLRRFRQNFLVTLRKVATVYDSARRIEVTEAGLQLPNAPPPVNKLLRPVKASLKTPS